MDTAKVSRSRAERWFGVRYPLVYLGLAILWLATVVTAFLTPGFFGGSGGAIALKIVIGVLALGMAALSVVNLVMQRRGIWFTEPAPLAQESDPRLRHTP